MLFRSRALPIVLLLTVSLYIIVTLVVYQIVLKSNPNERIKTVEDSWHFNHIEPNDQRRRKQRARRPIMDDERNRFDRKMGDDERERSMNLLEREDAKRLQGDPSFEHYKRTRDKYDKLFPSPNENLPRLLNLVQSLRKNTYKTFENDIPYDIHNCPDTPPDNYPHEWKLYDDIITHWNPDIPTPKPDTIHQSLCIFDHQTEKEKAEAYREAEAPFILRNDPNILSIAERWNHPDYLSDLLGSTQTYKSEFSTSNHFMFWRRGRQEPPPGWKNPTDTEYEITFTEWLHKAKQAKGVLQTNQDHVYFRLNGCKDSYRIEKCLHKMGAGGYYISQEIPFFSPKQSFYIVEPDDFRGINCRFGMNGIIAENHFDGSRNMIILLGGERRYILAHPNQCHNMELYPRGHPSGRHSSVDWSNPDFGRHPKFRNAMGNEVVLQAGDLLYLPTFWFHYIISLDEVNYQCNARSGITSENSDTIHACGF